MKARTIGVSEARKLLPALVRSIATDGGRVDITYRGRPQVTLLRVSDVRAGNETRPDAALDPALRVELKIPASKLVAAIRELRAGHQPRTRVLFDEAPRAKKAARSGEKSPPRKSPRRAE